MKKKKDILKDLNAHLKKELGSKRYNEIVKEKEDFQKVADGKNRVKGRLIKK